MKSFFARVFRMIFGLFLFALGIMLTIRANIGYAPWEVFHVGIADTLGLSLGVVSIAVGIIILLVTKLLGEKVGFGAILNMLLIGIFLNIIIFMDFIPKMGNFFYGIIMLVLGLIIISIGSYFYIGSGFGAGPRDNLMIVLAKKTKISAGICRSIIEMTVLIIGWFLGGMAGLGTVISVFGIGFCIQITFKILKFDVTAVKHESLAETLVFLLGKANKGKEP